ncbi:MAG: hypothetical protein JKY70_01760 [Mucilaginibacter sp.]|nr:hypothetical protein [Mucilaginibacter sp.]
MLHLVREENDTLMEINEALAGTEEIDLLRYFYGQIIIADGFTTNQAAKVELDFLKSSFETQKMNFHIYLASLRDLNSRLSRVKVTNHGRYSGN